MMRDAALDEVTGGSLRRATVSTKAILPVHSLVVWAALVFYEEIRHRPPPLLRALVPQALRSEGDKRCIGGVVRCSYRRGHLLKVITDVGEGRVVAFDVREQNLHILGGVRLLGGSIVIEPLRPWSTRVTLTTRYALPDRRPAWLRSWLAARVAHAFHRHLLEGMRLECSVRAELQSH